MKEQVRWGILGCGNIARRFTEAFEVVENGVVMGAASRSLEKAGEFASNYGIPRAFGSYDELLSDPEIDAIYVATPHSHHEDNVTACFEHGKPVLCEKPLTVNADQTRRLKEMAKDKELFLMEAMWTRFLPTIK